MFTLKSETALGRRGTLQTAHGSIETPFFMPVGTAGAMKGMTHENLEELGAQILLCNTYHLHLHPGSETIADAGGLHGFVGWEKPILTDSGGFQVFSLRNISKISDDGVKFRSHINGDEHFIGPEESITIQHNLGADIIMVFDECPPSTAKRQQIEQAVDRTLLWAQESKKIHEKLKLERGTSPLLFGIVQGGLEQDLRQKCAEELIAIGFDGYALGGLAVGEGEDEMYDVVKTVTPLLPKDQLRYLMGVGELSQLRECVRLGIDMFDCVLPMRIARHGTLLMSDGSQIRINNAPFKEDHSILDPHSPSPLSRRHKKSFVHHLYKMNERLGETIGTMQNMAVTLDMMKELREKMDAE